MNVSFISVFRNFQSINFSVEEKDVHRKMLSFLYISDSIKDFRKSKAALINSHRLKKPKDDQTDTNFIEFPRTHLQSCFLKQQS